MKRWSRIVPILGISLLACSSGPAGSADGEKDGTLSLNLTGVDSRGDTYRLRSAEFEISGFPDFELGEGGGSSSYFFEVVSSEDDIDAPVITKRLLPGWYDVFFASTDWYLERLTRSGAERVEQSVLLSSRWRSARIWDRSTTRVVYQFGVDGEIIDFRNGDLEIGIDVERPEDGEGGEAGFGGAPAETAGAGGSF